MEDIRPRGFTLIELIVAMVLVAVLVALAAPAFQDLAVRNRVSTYAAQWMAVLNTVRAEAIKRNRQVSLCPSGNGLACDPSLTWGDGWLLFADDNGNGSYEAASERLLQVGGALDDGYLIIASKHDDWFAYRRNGVARGNKGAGNNTFLICRPGAVKDELVRRVVTSVVGRPRVAEGLDDKTCEKS